MDLYLLKYPFRHFLSPLLKKLSWLHPDVVSYAAVLVAAATGVCFYFALEHPSLLLLAIVLIFVRMTLNTFDGLLAIQRDRMSLKGEVVNALPDRYSDIFLFVGIALSPLCRDWLGVAALSTVFLVSYTGMLGKALTVSWQHQGPMGKVERFFTVMIFALLQFIVLPERQAITLVSITATPLEWGMALIVVLGQYTVLRRLSGQIKEIRRKEAIIRDNRGRAAVVFDSATGNTEKVAREIARGLGCKAVPVSEAGDMSGYEMVVLGSPNIRKQPSKGMQQFQQSQTPGSAAVAVFVTYGVPVWGSFTSSACIKSMSKAWALEPLAHFSCPGFHRKYKTFKKRPGDIDLLNAVLFGQRLAKILDNKRSES